MNNKMTIIAVVGIITLSLLAMKPLTNEAFAKCSSDLGILAHIGVQTVPKGQTTPVGIHGSLRCGSEAPGARLSFYVDNSARKSRSGSTSTLSRPKPGLGEVWPTAQQDEPLREARKQSLTLDKSAQVLLEEQPHALHVGVRVAPDVWGDDDVGHTP